MAGAEGYPRHFVGDESVRWSPRITAVGARRRPQHVAGTDHVPGVERIHRQIDNRAAAAGFAEGMPLERFRSRDRSRKHGQR
jgi:hypothetical protein